MDFLAMLRKVGFQHVELVKETGLNSTPKTKGVLVKALKPRTVTLKLQPMDFMESNTEKAAPFMDIAPDMPKKDALETADEKCVHVPDHSAEKIGGSTLDAVIEKAFQLGAEKVKIIDTATIIVEKWVRWKCLYGCPLHGKDAYHPPISPGVEETREVLGEYAKAVLLNGSNGVEITDIAVKLESAAYQMGFYKAFALTALPSAPPKESKAPGIS